VATALVFIAGARTAVASPIASVEYVETSLGGGLFQYDYSVHNLADPATDPADAGADLYWLTLIFSPSVSLVGATTPANWDAIGGSGFVDLFSLVPGAAPAGADIGPGQLLSGFSVLLNGQIGSSAFQALFTNVADPFNPVISEGSTLPRPSDSTPVPEPATLVLVAWGMGSLAARWRRPTR